MYRSGNVIRQRKHGNLIMVDTVPRSGGSYSEALGSTNADVCICVLHKQVAFQLLMRNKAVGKQLYYY